MHARESRLVPLSPAWSLIHRKRIIRGTERRFPGCSLLPFEVQDPLDGIKVLLAVPGESGHES